MTNETDRVGQYRLLIAIEIDAPQRGIQRCEQLIGSVDRGTGDAIEECRLAGVGIYHQCHRIHAAAVARTTALMPLALHFFQSFVELIDTLLNHAPVGLELSFARAAPADAALLPF